MTGHDGLFIAFEGGDGAGKSTQVRLLADALRARGREVLTTRQPGGTELGAAIRELVLHGDHVSPRAEVLLFAADKAHHVDQLVRPALDRGEVVITDRYVDSTLAYQGAGRDLDVADVELVARWATHGLRPHLTVVLDLEPSDGHSRFEGRDRIEGEPEEFFTRVRQAFLDLAAADSDHYLVLDARRSPEEIAGRVAAEVAPLLDHARRKT